MRKMHALLALCSCAVFPALGQVTGISPKQTEVMKSLLAGYETQARAEATDKKTKASRFKPFTAEEGRKFYLMRRTWQSSDPTCSGCHTEDPTKEGRHIETKAPIRPLAPAASPERFVDAEKVERNFSSHCVDLLGRFCNASEKGHFLTYLMSLK